jgi:aspartate/methionine/tyrosine aminotransferase
VDVKPAHSAELVPHSRIRELANIAFGMKDVLSLYFGESNQPTPEFIKDAAARALAEGHTFYTPNAGLLSLREALRDYYLRLHNVTLDPAREIVVTVSGVQALNVAIRCMLDPGDEALVLTPAWPNGGSIITMANARPVYIPQPLRGGRFEIDWDLLEASVTPRTRMLLYTSPSNPLGWVATEADQEKLLEFARRHSLWLLADEVYERLWFETAEPGTPVPSILRKATRDDAVVVTQSFSKAYCMTGWRLGWLVARADLAEKAAQLNEFIVSCAWGVTQKAGEAALAQGEPEIRRMLARLKVNRDFCLDALSAMPRLNVPRPEGAFYLFPHVEGLNDSFDFCKRLLLETHVGIAPGVAFGPGGEGSVRICYAADESVLRPAMDRIGAFLRC